MSVLRVSLLVMVAACGSAKQHAPQTLHVDITGMKYAPDALTISVGDTIEWKNDDLVPHTVTGVAFDSASIAPHGTWSYVATAPGDLAYHCTFHPMMVGSIIVR